MVQEVGEHGPQRFEGMTDAKTFLRAGYDLDDPDFWGNVNHYVDAQMMRTGCSSAPRKLAAA